MAKFMIYAAAYVFLKREGTIYLMRRANTGYRDGMYSLPAGHIEAGESLKEAALRELEEEAGVVAQAEDLVQAHAMYRRYPERTYADYYFVCDTWEGEPTICEPEKCDDARWVDGQNLPENTVEEVRHAWACIRRGEAFSDITHAN